MWYASEIAPGQVEAYPHADVLHLRGACWDNCEAPSLVKQARHDFGLQLAARNFTSRFFKNGAHIGGVLQLPPGFKEEVAKKIEQGLREQREGSDKAFRSFALPNGYRWFPTAVEPQKAQLVELDDQQVRHVARWFRMHPSRLGVQDTVSYNSLEQAKKDYHDTTLSYWLARNQAQCNAKLLSASERAAGKVIRYQINALLWADAKTRNEIAVSGIQAGRFSPDETRNWEDLNPRDDGEGHLYLRPLNMEAVRPNSDADPPEDDRHAAHTRLLKTVVRRVATRLVLHADRARKRGDFETWLRTAAADHRQVSAEMFADVLPAINAALGLDLQAPTVAEATLRRALELLAAGQDLAQLPEDLARLTLT